MSEHETHEVVVSICGPVPDWCRCEIVRCRDCKHYENTGNCHYWASYEPIPGGNEFMEVLGEVTADGFCAWGERKDSESLEVWNQWSADDVTRSEES